MDKIRLAIGDSPIYLIVDETHDAKGRYVLNIMVGKLAEKSEKPYLLLTDYLKATNASTIQQAILKALNLLWKGELEFNKFWLLLSDQATYMLKAGRNLKSMFQKLKHVTCLAHCLNLACDDIKTNNGTLNSFIANMKRALCKSHARRQLYETHCNTFPPEVFEIRWGTCLCY